MKIKTKFYYVKMGNKHVKAEHKESGKNVETGETENRKSVNSYLNKLKEHLDALMEQLIEIDYIDQNGNVQEDVFLQRLKLVHTNILTGLNEELFKGDTYKFGLEYNDNSTIQSGKNEIKVSKIIYQYQDKVIKLFKTKYDIWTSINEFLSNKNIEYFKTILKNYKEMLQGVNKQLYEQNTDEVVKNIQILENAIIKLIKYIKLALDPLTTKQVESLYTKVSDLITNIENSLCTSEKDLKYFLWECEGEECNYIPDKSITYKGLPKVNASIMQKIPEFEC